MGQADDLAGKACSQVWRCAASRAIARGLNAPGLRSPGRVTPAVSANDSPALCAALVNAGRARSTAGASGLMVVALALVLTMLWAVAVAGQTAPAQTGPQTQMSTDAVALARARDLLAAGDAGAARAAFATLAAANDAAAQDALAAMWLEGIGGAKDRETAMYWFCRLAHQPRGGRVVMRALWFLAEYFRTGGGLPGRRYGDGTPALQNPLKAFFWYQLMVHQAQLYEVTLDEALKLGRLGSASVARELRADEQQAVLQRVQRWSPRDGVASEQACLDLPQIGE